jgi:uncharacterized protein YqgV (UPF0045/DUF77 family)
LSQIKRRRASTGDYPDAHLERAAMIASAQVSVYPLRQEHLGPTIDMVRQALEAHGLQGEVGPMSTTVTGDAAVVFRALADAFDKAARTGQVVMTFTVSNACPVPPTGKRERDA